MTIGVLDKDGAAQTVKTIDDLLGSGPKTLTDLATAIAATNTKLDSVISGAIPAGAGTAAAAGRTTLASDDPAVVQLNKFGTGKYVAVAASQTDSVIQLSSGAVGDYLDHVIVVPATTAPGVVTIKDNATALISYPGGGTTALLTLTPFTIYVGAVSSSGAWKITTGANVSILAVGKFT